MNRRLLAPAAILLAITLAGCSPGTDAEREQAYEECKQKVTPQFDDSAAVTWPDDGYGFSGSGDSRQIVAVVEQGDDRIEVSCMLADTDEGWELSSYDVSEPRDEVVN